jgi:flagellar biosynthetic protein FliR
VIDLTPLASLGLLLVRPGMLLFGSPAFGGTYAPAQVKLGLTLLLAVALLPSTAVPPVGAPIAIIAVVFREAAIGLALGMAIRALAAAAELAGHLLGFQMGLSYSAIVDPQSGVRNNLIAALYANMAIVTFFIVNGHHAFLRALRDSYDRLPIGAGHVDASVPEIVIRMLGLIFTLGVRLAAPLVVVLVVVELGMAIIARSAPAFNLMAVGAPVRGIVGLLLLGLVASAAVGVLGGSMNGVLDLGVRATTAFR